MAKPFSLVNSFVPSQKGKWSDNPKDLDQMSDEEKLEHLFFIRPYAHWSNIVHHGIFPIFTITDLSEYRESMLNDLHALKRVPARNWIQENTLYDPDIMHFIQDDNYCSISDIHGIHRECQTINDLHATLLAALSLLRYGTFDTIMHACTTTRVRAPAVFRWLTKNMKDFSSVDLTTWLDETYVIQHSGYASWMLDFCRIPIQSERKALQLARALNQQEFKYWDSSQENPNPSESVLDREKQFYRIKHAPYFYAIRLRDVPVILADDDEREQLLKLTLRRFDLLKPGESLHTGIQRADHKFPEASEWIHRINPDEP